MTVCVYIIAYIKLRNYWTKGHQIYIQSSQIIAYEPFNQNCDIAICFAMPWPRIKVNSPIFANFDPKIGCNGYVPRKRGIRSVIYDQTPTIR